MVVESGKEKSQSQQTDVWKVEGCDRSIGSGWLAMKLKCV